MIVPVIPVVPVTQAPTAVGVPVATDDQGNVHERVSQHLVVVTLPDGSKFERYAGTLTWRPYAEATA